MSEWETVILFVLGALMGWFGGAAWGVLWVAKEVKRRDDAIRALVEEDHTQ